MSGFCNGCGGCCNPVTIPRRNSKTAIRKKAVVFTNSDPERVKEWILHDLTRISKEEAFRRRPALAPSHTNAPGVFYYECRHFDPVTHGKLPVESGVSLVELPDCSYAEDLISVLLPGEKP